MSNPLAIGKPNNPLVISKPNNPQAIGKPNSGIVAQFPPYSCISLVSVRSFSYISPSFLHLKDFMQQFEGNVR